MINKKEVSTFLKKEKFIASKKMGQNFLIDQNIAFKIVKLIKNLKPDFVLEIGPGLGSITEIAKQIPNISYKAIEIDKRLVEYLKKNNILSDNEIISDDALKINWDSLISENVKVCLFGNLPYSISSPLIFKFINSKKITSAIFMLQLEMSERINAKLNTNDYNAFSVFAQYYLKTISKNFIVEPTSFLPQPGVRSCVSLLEKNTNLTSSFSPKEFKDFLIKCFNQRRKTLINNLKSFYPKNEIEKNLQKLSIDLNVRPQELKPEVFVKLMDQLVCHPK